MENIVLGFLAHVDRGKTSLSESLIFEAGRFGKKAVWIMETVCWTMMTWSGKKE